MNRCSRTFVAVVAAAPWIALLVAAGPVAGAAPAAQPDKLDGKAIFLAQKCNLCHAVSSATIERTSKSEKMKGPDLAGVGKRREAVWMRRWLAKEESVNGKKHLFTFKGTPQELDALIAWLGKA